MRRDEGKLAGDRGAELFWRAWLPDDGTRAVVTLAHGAGEHSGRYEHVGERLASAGYALYAVDLRGHGRSSGPRAYVHRIEHAVGDVAGCTALARSRHPEQPAFLLGHSFGGTVALAYVRENEQDLAGLVVSAPLAVLKAASPLTRVIARTLSVLTPRLGLIAVDPAHVSRDPEVVRAYREDPLVFHGKLPARTIAEMGEAIERFPDDLPELQLPLLVLSPTADRLVPPAGSELVFERAGSPDKRIVRYEGLYHEPFNEPERDRVLDDLVGWLDEHSR